MSDEQSSFDIEDKRRLERTLTIREQIITDMTKDGMPKEEENRRFLMSALDGIDRTVLTRARIKSDENGAKSQQQTAALIGELLKRVSHRPVTATNQKPPLTLDASIVVTDPVAGETDVGVQILTYDKFMESQQS